jgi:predicted acylesterase/phospholipase RssA
LLLAATAYPVLFPPVLIDDTLHIDGGTREQIFAQQLGQAVMLAYSALIRDITTKPQAYLIVNAQLVTSPRCVTMRIPAMGARAIDLAQLEGMIGNLHKIRSFLSPTWELNLSAIPDDFPIDPSKDSFDTDQANRIYQRGLEWGRTRPWVKAANFPDGRKVSPLPCTPGRNS